MTSIPGERNPFTTPVAKRVSCIQHANVETSDVARTQQWYKKVFDAEWTEENPRFLRLGSSELHIHVETNPQPHASNHFAIEVNDWADMMAHLKRAGVVFDGGREPRVTGTGKHTAFVRDPDGNLIEVMHHPSWHKD